MEEETKAQSLKVQTLLGTSIQFKYFGTQEGHFYFSPLSSGEVSECLQFILRSDMKFLRNMN